MALAILSDSVDTETTVTLTEDNIGHPPPLTTHLKPHTFHKLAYIPLSSSTAEVSAQKVNTTGYSDVVYPKDGAEGSDKAQIRIPATHLSSRNAPGYDNY